MHKLRFWLSSLADQLENIAATFGGSTVWILVACCAFSIGMFFLNDQLIVNTREKTDTLAGIDQLITETWKARAALMQAESSQRGFLLTKSNEYAKPYEKATKDLTIYLHNIDHLLIRLNLGGNQKIQAIMVELLGAASKKSAEMSVTVDLAKRKQFEKAMSVVKLDSGLKESKHIEELVIKFEAGIQAMRHQLVESRDFSRELTRWEVMISPLILIGLVIVVIRRLLQELAEKAKLHSLLKQENHSYEKNVRELKTKLQGLALEAQTDIERERYQLARELHDELGSLLTAIKMDIAWAVKQIKDQLPLVTEKLAKTNQYLDRSINFKREIVQSLHPSMIKSFGLIASLQNLIDEAKVRNQWEVNIIFPDLEPDLNETISLIIYRIVQESLNNASKYANAKHISVHLMHDEQYTKLEIGDNGVGFDVNASTESAHGIKGMRHRVESIGGHYEITSAAKQGTSIRVLLPHIHKTT